MLEPLVTLGSVISILAPIAPNILGGAFALWRIQEDIKWSEKSTRSKVYTLAMTPVVFIAALLFGHYFGGTLTELAQVTRLTPEGVPTLPYAFIMVLTTASSLRFLKKFMVRIEEIYDVVFDGVTGFIRKLFKMKNEE